MNDFKIIFGIMLVFIGLVFIVPTKTQAEYSIGSTAFIDESNAWGLYFRDDINEDSDWGYFFILGIGEKTTQNKWLGTSRPIPESVEESAEHTYFIIGPSYNLLDIKYLKILGLFGAVYHDKTIKYDYADIYQRSTSTNSNKYEIYTGLEFSSLNFSLGLGYANNIGPNISLSYTFIIN